MTRGRGVVAVVVVLAVAAALALVAAGGLGGSAETPGDASSTFQRRCPDPVLTTSEDRTWDDGGFVVDQDMWNNNQGGTQTLSACSYRLWSVTATQPDTADVNTYPNVHRDFDEPSLASFSSITSTFATHGPGQGAYEFAYDVWLDGVATPGSTEVMVWTDNHGNAPTVPQRGTFTSDGVAYTIYQGGHYLAFVGPNRPQGKVDLLAFFRYAVRRGWLHPASTVGQIDFGVEISSTDGTPLDFAVTDFSLETR
jgi:Glycosyl hydrolase family 12